MPDTKKTTKSPSHANPTEPMPLDANEKPLVVTGDNIFAALGLPNAEERHAKMKLALRIGAVLKERKLTQAQAAQIIGMAQSDVSQIVSGRTGGFTLERLLHAVNQLGYDIDIVVRAKPGMDEVGHTAVTFIK